MLRNMLVAVGVSLGVAACSTEPVAVATVQLSQNSLSLTVGATATVVATPLDADGVALTGRTVSWSSGDLTIATVSESGIVTAVAAGTTTITATCEGISSSVTVTVSAVSGDAARGQNGSMASFVADNVFSDGTEFQLVSITGDPAGGSAATAV